MFGSIFRWFQRYSDAYKLAADGAGNKRRLLTRSVTFGYESCRAGSRLCAILWLGPYDSESNGGSMARLACIGGVLAAFLSTPIMAADVELAGRTLHLEPGAGLCALLAEDPRDAVRIDMIRGAERDLAEVAGYWADCKVLDDWRNGRTKLLMPYVLILAPFPEGHVVVVPFDMPQDEYMAEQKRAILEF